MKASTAIRSFIIGSSILIIFSLCALSWIYEISLHGVSSSLGQIVFRTNTNLPPPQPNDTVSQTSSSQNDIRVLIGILTLPDNFERRHFLRMIYGTQNPLSAKIDVKFILCNLTNDEHKVLVALEIMRYNDIIILKCEENMNKGKTYTYFSSLPEVLNDTNLPYPPYHYVMKADDDTYIRLENFAQSLRLLPRKDLYYGFMAPCNIMNNPFAGYMAGWGYMVSWDLVEWIRESDIPRNNLFGHEDVVFQGWLRSGQKAKNRFDAKWFMYDIADPTTACSHEFWPDTIAVHKLKNNEKWIRTLNYFNATQNLKPSKLYHIP